jgi:competence protein ComEA
VPDTELLRPAPAPTWRDRVVALRTLARERPGAIAGAVVGVVVLALAGFFVLRTPAAGAPPTELSLPRADVGGAGAAGGARDPGSTTTTLAAGVVVHVAGAVVRPGLARLPAGARVADAVDAAGGLRPDADVDRLNLAAPLSDGQRVWVPIVGQDVPAEVDPAGGSPRGGAGAPAIVDLNTATAADLESLPGVGPATAQAILDQRRRVGRYRSVDDLLDVRGIGPAKLAALRDRVRV